jgi:FkbM family methyltransferase
MTLTARQTGSAIRRSEVGVRAAEIRQRFADIVVEMAIERLVFVGAHEGEEVDGLLAAGVKRLTLVEPIPLLAAKLRVKFPNVEVIECACSDRTGVATLRVMARTNMSTLLRPNFGDDVTSVISVPTRRLDDICPDADAAVIDVQGHEMAVLAAAPWDTLRLVMVETLYGVEDAALSPPYDTVVEFMAGKGFTEIARLTRDYDYIQKWAYGRTTSTGAEVRDVVFTKTP